MVNGQIVGRASLRHRLNDYFEREGGHIGYCVLPTHRRQGYGTQILRRGLELLRAHGIDRVLVTCHDDNVASAALIERCGGLYESTVPSRDGRSKRRFWID